MLKSLKKHVIALIVLAIAATSYGLMSFGEKQAEKLNLKWYEVLPNGNISSMDDPNLETECPATNTTDYCAVAFEEGTTPPSHISETDEGGGSVPTEGVRFRNP